MTNEPEGQFVLKGKDAEAVVHLKLAWWLSNIGLLTILLGDVIGRERLPAVDTWVPLAPLAAALSWLAILVAVLVNVWARGRDPAVERNATAQQTRPRRERAVQPDDFDDLARPDEVQITRQQVRPRHTRTRHRIVTALAVTHVTMGAAAAVFAIPRVVAAADLWMIIGLCVYVMVLAVNGWLIRTGLVRHRKAQNAFAGLFSPARRRGTRKRRRGWFRGGRRRSG
jgi:hypothetical protein